MPVSRTKQNRTNAADYEFVLKHRVVGAGVLLLFGALFLPWLLGAPGAASNVNSKANGISTPVLEDSGSTSLPSSTDTPAEALDMDLRSAIADEQALSNEEVYISKITPLSAQQDSEPSDVPQRLPVEGEDIAKSVSNSSAGVSESVQTDSQQNVDTIVAQNNSSTEPKQGSKTVESPNNAAGSTVKVGWIVQVGVFIEKAGAARVVQDLRKKGFNPSTSIVDTNRGKATGMRIWLGPFEQRVEAAKAKTQLKNETGEAGFIRAYP